MKRLLYVLCISLLGMGIVGCGEVPTEPISGAELQATLSPAGKGDARGRGPVNAPPERIWDSARPVAYLELERNSHGPFTSAGMLYIGSQEDWDLAFTEVRRNRPYGTTLPPEDAPETDFEHFGLILVSMGPSPVTCGEISIDEIRRHGNELIVSVQRTFRNSDGICLQSASSPHCIVRVPKHPAVKKVSERTFLQ